MNTEPNDRQLTIVNPSRPLDPVPLQQPPGTGYLHLAGMVGSTVGRTPFPRRDPRKNRVLAELKRLASDLRRLDTVTQATVSSAALIPPINPDARHLASRPARFDVAVLVETRSVDVLDAAEYRALRTAFDEAAQDLFEMRARCARMIADVDKSRQGLFLFNYFVTERPAVTVELWEHLARWYAANTGLDNSTLLAPLAESGFALVNHARWDKSLARFAFEQFSKPSFRSYVLANMRANGTAAMPILFHRA